jgi:hypothetical protein
MMLNTPVAKVRTTLTIDEDVLKWIKIRAHRTGVSDSAVIEETLRRDLKLDVLDELWSTATLRAYRHDRIQLLLTSSRTRASATLQVSSIGARQPRLGPAAVEHVARLRTRHATTAHVDSVMERKPGLMPGDRAARSLRLAGGRSCGPDPNQRADRYQHGGDRRSLHVVLPVDLCRQKW